MERETWMEKQSNRGTEEERVGSRDKGRKEAHRVTEQISFSSVRSCASPGRMTHLGISFNKGPSSQTGEEETWTQLTSAAPETSKPHCNSSLCLTSIKRLMQFFTFFEIHEILICFFSSFKNQSQRGTVM